jgi:hypothetical protein
MAIRFGILAAAAVVAALAPTAVRADGIQGRWSIGLQGGTDLELSGNVHEGGSGTVLGLATAVQAKSFNDVYNPSFRGQLSVGYGVGPQSELLLRGSYYKLSSDTLQVGTVAGLVLNADFADYKEWGVEAAFRQYLSAGRLKPYVGVVAGARFVSELPSTFSVPAAGVVLADVPFYDKSTVGVFGADIGVAYSVNDSVSIGVETGPRYQTKPSRLNGLAGTGLESINDTGSRWSMPVLATLTFRF